MSWLDKAITTYHQANDLAQQAQQWYEGPQPSLDDLLAGYRTQGVIGEEDLLLTQTFALLGRVSFGIVAGSGSGKSFTLESMLSLFPKDMCYRIELASRKASFYDPQIKKAKYLYLPELQKAATQPEVKELLKGISEGKPVTYMRTEGKSIQKITIPPKPILFTLAKENTYKLDTELARRCLLLKTDESEKQTQRVVEATLQGHAKRSPPKALTWHLQGCLSAYEVHNPYASNLLEMLPQSIHARSLVHHLVNLAKGSTIYHHKEREKEGKILKGTKEDIENVQYCLPILLQP